MDCEHYLSANNTAMDLKRQLGVFTATLVIIADMIGTGIFVTTGSVLGMTHSAMTVLILWAVGGVVALTGALCYAELATMWPEAGGEYVYLKKSFGQLPSFLTGWISLVVGFSAPIATSALTLIQYLNQFWQNIAGTGSSSSGLFAGLWTQKILASAVIVVFGAMHILGVKRGSRIQNMRTMVKILIAGSLAGGGLLLADWGQAQRLSASYAPAANVSPGTLPTTGLALLIIMFSYSGWNAATYLAGEIKQPERNLPKALFYGTLITTVLYLTLNLVFLIAAPGSALMGQEAVGAIAAKNLFGIHIAQVFNLGIVLILLSSISVQMMIGPRVYYAMAKDRMLFQRLADIHPQFATPALAISIQILLSVFYVFVGSATVLLEYMGFALSIFPLLTVCSLIYMRRKRPDLARPYKVPFYPWVPCIYITLSLAMMVAGYCSWTQTSRFALGVVGAGIPIFYLWRAYRNKRGAVSVP